MKILCVIPSLPEDLNPECVNSVLAQTLPVSMIVILSERVHGETLPEKISEVLNRGLADLRMENYDYILRVDGDTILPENFLEENLKDNPDLCGKGGYAHIIKVKPFTEFFKGKFHKKNDDTYFNLKFRLLGLKVTDWKVPPKLTRQSGARHGLRYFWDRGILLYRMGFEPIHFLADIAQDIRCNVRNFLCVFGYLNACLKRLEKFDFAKSVWNYQVRRLLFGKSYAMRSAGHEA